MKMIYNIKKEITDNKTTLQQMINKVNTITLYNQNVNIAIENK